MLVRAVCSLEIRPRAAAQSLDLSDRSNAAQDVQRYKVGEEQAIKAIRNYDSRRVDCVTAQRMFQAANWDAAQTG